MAVVDTSVLLSALIPIDTHHTSCKAWLDRIIEAKQQVSAPSIILSEVAAPLGRAHNKPQVGEKLVQHIMNSPYMNLIPVSIPLAKRAAIIGANYKIRGCDAIYVALAELLDEELVTLDQQQAERAKSIVRVYHP
ncbi:MAG: type II toxin-antitoxin system VapC family toxin [Anaerolineales bacterium]|nr:type II toxin-antitoxin system VapC family toxin [Anaerolineales bacterium]